MATKLSQSVTEATVYALEKICEKLQLNEEDSLELMTFYLQQWHKKFDELAK